MKFRTRCLALVVVLAMLACGTALADLNPVGTLPISDETNALSIGLSESNMVEDFKTCAQTVKIENDLNVDLEFILLASSSEFNTKIDLMMMSGETLPDILFGVRNLSTLVNYAGMGKIIPLTPYYDDGSACFMEQTLAKGGITLDDIRPYITSYDREIYGAIAYTQNFSNEYNSDFAFVYEPWLEKLGLEKPQTTDEFVELLRAFRDQDPNGNGEADEIPMMGYNGAISTNMIRYLMNPFVYTQEHYFSLNTDTGLIEFVADDEEWKEGIKWVKSLVEEGLISPLSFTQDQSQLTAIMNPEPEVVGVVSRYSVTNLGATDIRRSQYICLDPLEGPEGVRWATRMPTVPSVNGIITTDCKNPDAAFRFLDYCCEEIISVWNRYGEEGVDWVQPVEGAVGAFEQFGYPAKLTVVSTWGVLQNHWWGTVGPVIILVDWASGQAIENIEYNAAVAIGRSMEKYVEFANPNAINGLVYNEDETEVINEYQSTIDTYVVNSWSEFVTGVRNIDDEWDAYVGEFSLMGLDEYMAAAQSSYDRMFK